MGNQADEIIKDFFQSLLQNYQKDLDKSMRSSGFVIYGVDSLYYYLKKTSLGRKGRSYIDSSKWLEK